MCFKNLIGNDENKKLLKKMVKNKSILNSYMFYGNEGIGKKLFAIEFSKMILCENESEFPCGKCKSCIEFESKNNPDFLIIEPDGNSIKIDQIRAMQEGILEKPINEKKKIYIINNADLMTKEAQNCLLKTLEEPQDYVVIILIVSNENSILSTVKSRCMKIFFKDIDDVNKFIQIQNKDVHFEKNMIKLCAGSIGKTIEITENYDILKKLEEFIEKIESLNKLQILNYGNLFYENKDKINLLLDYMEILLFEKSKENSNKIIYINSIKQVEIAKEKIKKNNNFTMSIDNMLIKISNFFNN